MAAPKWRPAPTALSLPARMFAKVGAESASVSKTKIAGLMLADFTGASPFAQSRGEGACPDLGLSGLAIEAPYGDGDGEGGGR